MKKVLNNIFVFFGIYGSILLAVLFFGREMQVVFTKKPLNFIESVFVLNFVWMMALINFLNDKLLQRMHKLNQELLEFVKEVIKTAEKQHEEHKKHVKVLAKQAGLTIKEKPKRERIKN